MSMVMIYIFLIIFLLVFILWIRKMLKNSNTLMNDVKRYAMQQGQISEAEMEAMFKQPNFLQWMTQQMNTPEHRALNEHNAVAIFGQKIIRYYREVYNARVE